MTAPAPYNPATLNRIRQGASASQLGWGEDRYARVCRNHGIERVARASETLASAASVVAEVVSAPAPIPPASALQLRLESDTPYTLLGASVCVTINSPQQIKIMNLLLKNYRLDPSATVSGAEIAHIIGTSPECARQHIFNLTRRIAPTGWCINGNKGRGGGYNLALVRTLSGAAAP